MQEGSVGARFDAHRWGNLFVGSLQGYFKSLRHVNRFLSSLSLHVELFKNGDSFEVNPIDLIGIEVLRVFEPGVYKLLATRKDALTSNENGERGRHDEVRKLIQHIVEQAPDERREHVTEIMKALFPPAEWALGGSHYAAGFSEEWQRELRVCSPAMFDRYFALRIPEGDLSQAQLDRILTLTNDREALRAEFGNLAETGLLDVALDRLEAYKQRVPVEHGEAFVTAIFDTDGRVSRTNRGMFGISPAMHALRIVLWFLRQEKDLQRRTQILTTAVRDTSGFALATEFVSLEDSGSKPKERTREYERVVDDAGLAELKRICVEKISAAAASGTLTACTDMASLLYRWKEWGVAADVTAYCRGLVGSPPGALIVAKAFLSRSTSQTMGDYVARERYYVKLSNIEAFVSAEDVEKGLQGIVETAIGEDGRRALEAFRQAMQRRRSGKPDTDGFGTPSDDE